MEDMKLTFVNVGYGEAIVLECPDPARPGGVFVMVIDGGSGEAEEYRDRSTGRVPLADYLAGRELDRIDVITATHIHEDHLCGLLPLLDRWVPGELWQTLPADLHRSLRPLPPRPPAGAMAAQGILADAAGGAPPLPAASAAAEGRQQLPAEISSVHQ